MKKKLIHDDSSLGQQGDADYGAERKRCQLANAILTRLNHYSTAIDTIRDVVKILKESTGVDAVGIRMSVGEDFPYYAQSGFTQDHVCTENTLVVRDQAGNICRNNDGSCCMACTCGLVLSGKVDPANPLFTEYGSFWSSHSETLLDLPAGQDPRLHPRNRCIHDGYRSIALIPLRADDVILGLIQLNHRQAGRFTLDMIQNLEELAISIAIALKREQAEENLRKMTMELEGRVGERTRELQTVNESLRQEKGQRLELEREVLAISERERSRIGQDLHDGVGQSIAGIGYLISALQQRLSRRGATEAAELERLKTLVEKNVLQVRQMAHSLYPGEMEKDGLIGALQELALYTQDICGITCNCLVAPPITLKNKAVACQLYRIAQEALNNAVKYSKAKTVTIELRDNPEGLVMSIIDMGVGFARNPSETRGMGQRIMKYRAEMIGATLTIESVSGEGTAVTCVCPFKTDRAVDGADYLI